MSHPRGSTSSKPKGDAQKREHTSSTSTGSDKPSSSGSRKLAESGEKSKKKIIEVSEEQLQKELDREQSKKNELSRLAPISKEISSYQDGGNFADQINTQQAALQKLVGELQDADRDLLEIQSQLNVYLHQALVGTLDKELDHGFTKFHEKEGNYTDVVVAKEKEIDTSIRDLRRVYIKGAINLALNKPSEEQIKQNNDVLRDYRVSMKRFVSCKETLLGCSSFSVDDRSNPHFRNVTSIHECDIQRIKLIGRSTNVHEGTYLNTKVAIKKFHTTIEKERLQILKDMECHKNIVALRGIVLNDEPGTTLVLQLAENGNLKDAFESNQYVFRFSRKIQWMKQLGQALEWIHERSRPILHLRLHPANLLLSTDFRLKIADYGLGFAQPNAGMLVGNMKPFFIAPELLGVKVDDDIEAQSTMLADIYSYGACLWYILTEKKNKWKNISFDQVKSQLHAKNKDSGVLPATVDPALNKLIFDCTSQNPNERPQSMAAILETPWQNFLNYVLTGSASNNAVTDIWEHAKTKGKLAVENGNNGNVYLLDLAASYHHKFGLKEQSHQETVKDENWRCMAVFLDVNGFSQKPAECIVKEEAWHKLCHFFKPIEEDDTNSTLAKFTSLCKMDWFFGKMSSKEAVQALSASKAHMKEEKTLFKRKKPCYFLVRESAGSQAGDKETKGTRTKGSVKANYTVSFFDSNVKVDQMSQIVVTEERLLTITTVDQLMSYINGKYNSKNGFEPCISGTRKYLSCFGSRQSAHSAYEASPDLAYAEPESQYEDQVLITYIQ